MSNNAFWEAVSRKYRKHKMGTAALFLVILFVLVGIYAPFFASSKPFVVVYEGHWYFPFFRYLFYNGFYTKPVDLFFNLLMFVLPLTLIARWLCGGWSYYAGLIVQLSLFAWLLTNPIKDPVADPELIQQRQIALQSHPLPNWDFDLNYMSPYAQLNLLLRQQNLQKQDHNIEKYEAKVGKAGVWPTLWDMERQQEQQAIEAQEKVMQTEPIDSPLYKQAQALFSYYSDKNRWINSQLSKIDFQLMPPVRPYHWEEDVGGDSELNQYLPWWDQSRINRKDLSAALIFGIRISLTVGLISVLIALAIGIPIGALAGYYAGTTDIIVSRLLELWESMPTFFMLLLVVAVTQSKSIFLVIAVIGFFGWTGFSRYIRGEFFKQRNLSYVEACHGLGYRDSYIIFSHILPNAIPPLLTLLPFAIMGAITSEAGLSFLGLGEEGSCSWGVLMDEGRTAFPAESGLLWPPAILLTILLVAIAVIGDSLRDVLDPKSSAVVIES